MATGEFLLAVGTVVLIAYAYISLRGQLSALDRKLDQHMKGHDVKP